MATRLTQRWAAATARPPRRVHFREASTVASLHLPSLPDVFLKAACSCYLLPTTAFENHCMRLSGGTGARRPWLRRTPRRSRLRATVRTAPWRPSTATIGRARTARTANHDRGKSHSDTFLLCAIYRSPTACCTLPQSAGFSGRCRRREPLRCSVTRLGLGDCFATF